MCIAERAGFGLEEGLTLRSGEPGAAELSAFSVAQFVARGP